MAVYLMFLQYLFTASDITGMLQLLYMYIANKQWISVSCSECDNAIVGKISILISEAKLSV